MREQFEKLPEIRDSLSEHIVFIGNTYTTPSPDFYDLVNWLNGAWHIYQEQQEKIARLQSALDDLKEWAQDEKQKSLDSDLSEYNNAKYVMAALFVENINRITGTDK